MFKLHTRKVTPYTNVEIEVGVKSTLVCSMRQKFLISLMK